MPDCLVAVPIRSFHASKTRLAGVLSETGRETLARRLAAGVLEALAPWRTTVVTTDPEVERWARDLGAGVLAPAADGLDAAARAAKEVARGAGQGWVAVVHADLAAPSPLRDVVEDATRSDRARTVTAVPDRSADGTNVLVVPAHLEFDFAYGPGSFWRHRRAAVAAGAAFVEVDDPDLAWDVDTPVELDWYRARTNG